MNRLNILIVIFFLYFSCKEKINTKEKEETNKILVSNQNLDEKIVINGSEDFIDSILEVQLETTPNLIGGLIWNVLSVDDYIYIFDIKLDEIYIFDIKGRYINCINNKGKGPNEYLRISDVFLDPNNNIVIHDFQQSKLLRYNKKGIYLKEDKINHDVAPFSLLELDNGNTLFITGRKRALSEDILNHDIFIETKDKKIITKLKNSNEIKSKLIAPGNYIMKNGGRVFFHVPPKNIIYEIVNTEIKPVYEIDLGSKGISEDAFLMKSDVAFREKYFFSGDYYIMMGSIVISENFIIVPLFKGQESIKNLLVSRNTLKYKLFDSVIIDNIEIDKLMFMCSVEDVFIAVNPNMELDKNPKLIMVKFNKF